MSDASAAAVYARFYDFDADFEHDLPHYRRLAAAADGPVLELACGSGRVLAALADAASHAVIGVDRSLAMLAHARRRLPADRPWRIAGDLRRIPLRGPFALILLPANALCLAAAPSGQIACLRECRRLLAPGGRLAFDVPNPAPFLADREPFGRELHLYTRTNPTTGHPTARYVTHQHDPVHQLILGHTRYVEYPPDGRPLSWVTEERLRYLHPQELRYLLTLCSLAVTRLTGGFDGRPLDARAPKMVVVAEPFG